LKKIIAELSEVQGKAADIGGYYAVDPVKVNAVMRPSSTLNATLETI
jgi:isocitrate dehydrogenase